MYMYMYMYITPYPFNQDTTNQDSSDQDTSNQDRTVLQYMLTCLLNPSQANSSHLSHFYYTSPVTPPITCTCTADIHAHVHDHIVHTCTWHDDIVYVHTCMYARGENVYIIVTGP